MNTKYRKPLAGTQLEYYDVRQAVEDIQPGASKNCLTPLKYSQSNWYAVPMLRT